MRYKNFLNGMDPSVTENTTLKRVVSYDCHGFAVNEEEEQEQDKDPESRQE